MRILTTMAVTLLFLTGCNNDPDSHRSSVTPAQQEHPASMDSVNREQTESPTPASSSQLSLDWSGTYSGVTPCASCPGIEVEITLNEDETFERSIRYIDRDPVPATDSGTFTWNDAGSSVNLNAEQGELQGYQVGENRLFQLDPQGQRIEGELASHYILHKHIEDPAIENRRWRLTELNGQPVQSDDLQTEPFILLHSEAARIHGNSSCNTFNGSYAIKEGQQIEFGQNIAMTMMACPDMTVEDQFTEVLKRVDNYTISDSGEMTLNRARMAPLARFIELRQEQ